MKHLIETFLSSNCHQSKIDPVITEFIKNLCYQYAYNAAIHKKIALIIVLSSNKSMVCPDESNVKHYQLNH